MHIPYVNLIQQNQDIREELVGAFQRVLEHGQFILGPELQELETKLAHYLGLADVIGVNSGTDALSLPMQLRGIGKGHEVITVSHSFVSTASTIFLVGATPVFADIDEQTMLMDPDSVRKCITSRTKAIMPVHLNGLPCDMDPIVSLCREYGLELIEDTAQALGARYRDRFAGTFGIGAFSLHPLKIVSALGDAGFIGVQSKEEAEKLRIFRNIGLLDRDHCGHIASNSRLDTLQAAFVLVKLKYLERWIEARKDHARAYFAALEGLVRLPPRLADRDCIWSAFVIRHPRRDALAAAMRARGIDVKIHYPLAIHQQPAFPSYHHLSLPVTEKVVSEILSLPVTPELSVEQREFVITNLRECLKEIGR